LKKRAKEQSGLPPFLGCFGSRWHNRVAYWFQDIRDSNWFQISIITVIFIAAILVGMQTYALSEEVTLVVGYVDDVVLAIFILELVVKFLAEGRFPWRFFRDAWNCFDFLIVLLGMLPIGGRQAVTVLRLIRLLRVLVSPPSLSRVVINSVVLHRNL
jgi:hypothetical protein